MSYASAIQKNLAKFQTKTDFSRNCHMKIKPKIKMGEDDLLNYLKNELNFSVGDPGRPSVGMLLSCKR